MDELCVHKRPGSISYGHYCFFYGVIRVVVLNVQFSSISVSKTTLFRHLVGTFSLTCISCYVAGIQQRNKLRRCPAIYICIDKASRNTWASCQHLVPLFYPQKAHFRQRYRALASVRPNALYGRWSSPDKREGPIHTPYTTTSFFLISLASPHRTKIWQTADGGFRQEYEVDIATMEGIAQLVRLCDVSIGKTSQLLKVV